MMTMDCLTNNWDINENKIINSFVGKRIKEISMADNVLALYFHDGSCLEFWDNGQDCCEHRYMVSDDDLSSFIAMDFMKAEVKDGPTIDEGGPIQEIQFLEITTSRGSFTIANYNDHNGYYGGFDISVRDAI